MSLRSRVSVAAETTVTMSSLLMLMLLSSLSCQHSRAEDSEHHASAELDAPGFDERPVRMEPTKPTNHQGSTLMVNTGLNTPLHSEMVTSFFVHIDADSMLV